jgi:hypothetical protein
MRNDLHGDEHVTNITSATANYSQDFVYTEDLKKSNHHIFINNNYASKPNKTSGRVFVHFH